MKSSNCCGAANKSNGDSDYAEYGICPSCKEHCEFIEDSEFVFARLQGASDIAPSGDIKRGVIYHHSWGTGYQTLIFENHEAAGKWWDAEKKRLSLTEATLDFSRKVITIQ
jgi:hypothetical protein